MGLLAQLNNLGAQGLRTGPLSGCACCADADGAHMNFDFNFGMNHINRCGTSAPKQPPPNRQLILYGNEVAKLVEEGSRGSAAVCCC